MALMLPCITLLAFDNEHTADEEGDDSGLSEAQLLQYRYLALFFGLLAPFSWTFAAYYVRKTVEQKSFKTWDLGVDSQLYFSIIQCFIYFAYELNHDFDLIEFLLGQLVGVLFTFGYVSYTMAFATGPGGPIIAISRTMVIY